jgi:quinol monooxygenase YgiN
MDSSLRMLLGSVVSAALSVAFVPVAGADDAAVAYVVTYIEVAPAAANEAGGLLKTFRDASRREEGNLRFDALHRSERPNHFAIVEAWKGPSEKLARLLSAAYDERPHIALSVAPAPASPAGQAAVYAVTHVDVIPTFKEQGVGIVKALAEASRKDAGSVRFDALTQSSRANHMTLVEAWQDRKAFDGHIVAAHVKKFREALGPMSGSLYDERLYTLVE